MGQWTHPPEMLEAILSSIDEGIHVVDAEGITIYYNRAIAELDGLTEEEVVGKHILDIFPSLDVHSSTLLQVLRTGEAIMNKPQFYTNLKGKQVETVNTTLPIFVKGALVGAIEVAKDISKIKELSEKVLDLQTQIYQETKKAARIGKLEKRKRRCPFTIEDLITQDPHMIELKKNVLRIAKSASPVLVYGETGTGKEIVVQALHNASERKDHPFIAQNCAALPSSLLESLLFGTKKGSFTGSVDRKGLFELANGGTLFLDELNAMPIELQAKLLRVLQEGYVRPVGGHEQLPINVRIIAAMNEDPWQAVKEGRLRSDLYYRIHVMSLVLPPLRERKEDIPLLTQHFIQQFTTREIKLSSDVERYFMLYHWPGNVRELEHALEAAVQMTEDGTLSVRHFPENLQRQWRADAQDTGEASEVKADVVGRGDIRSIPSLQEHLIAQEKYWIEQALKQTGGNIKRAAELLSIPRQTLQYKLKKYRLHP